MSVEIKVPVLGESISEATIVKWYKKPGDIVNVDELLLELETDKVTLEINATAEGILESIDIKENIVVSVGQIIGRINETATHTLASVKDNNNETTINNNTTINLPPSVQKMVKENNLNPNDITGTGKNGRINKGDIINTLNSSKVITTPVLEDTSNPVERIRMSSLRKTIAQRLKDSQNTAAILSTFNEIDMTNVIAIRRKYLKKFQEKHGIKLGFMSFFTKAVCSALQEVPSVNAEIEGDDIIYKKYYDIGVAVGTEQGLVVPVIRNANKLSFSEIEQKIVSLAVKAKEGKLSMQELTGSTFSITNGGIYGSLLSTPIINPPQTGIIGLHATKDRPVAIDGKVEIRPMMYAALSYDHRVIDGKDGVTFLIKVKEAIEDPERLLLNI